MVVAVVGRYRVGKPLVRQRLRAVVAAEARAAAQVQVLDGTLGVGARFVEQIDVLPARTLVQVGRKLRPALLCVLLAQLEELVVTVSTHHHHVGDVPLLAGVVHCQYDLAAAVRGNSIVRDIREEILVDRRARVVRAIARSHDEVERARIDTDVGALGEGSRHGDRVADIDVLAAVDIAGVVADDGVALHVHRAALPDAAARLGRTVLGDAAARHVDGAVVGNAGTAMNVDQVVGDAAGGDVQRTAVEDGAAVVARVAGDDDVADGQRAEVVDATAQGSAVA